MREKEDDYFILRKDHLYLLIALWSGVHIFLFYKFGLRDDFVDSRRYIGMADYFLEHGMFEGYYQLFYAIPIVLIAICRFLFVDGLIAFVLFQSMLSGVAALALYKSASILFGNHGAGFLSTAIYLLWLDCIQWNTTVMTESIAGSLICLVLYHITHFRDSIIGYSKLFFVVLLCILSRPTGVLVAVGVVAFLLTLKWNFLNQNRGLKFVVLSGLLAITCLSTIFMLNEWDFTHQYERGNIVTYMDTIEGQPHYHASLRLDTRDLTLPEPDRPPFEKIIFFAFQNPLHFLEAGALKVFYLVSGVRPYYSDFHNLYNIAWLSFIYSLFYVGYKDTADKPVRNFCLTILMCNCMLVGISAVDWDNRFFLPMQPAIVLLAGGGGWYLVRTLKKQLFLKHTRM